jgi:hypothetical protein
MCDDIEATMKELRGKGAEFSGEPIDMGFGLGTTILIPGGAKILLYQSRHASPLDLESA